MVSRMLALGIAAVVLAACAGDDEQADTSAPTGLDAAEAQGAEGAPLGDTVTVVGVGEVSGQPDVVRATVGVEVTADSADRALETASARASDVIAALQDAGVAEEDIQTQEISLREERDRPPPPEPGTSADGPEDLVAQGGTGPRSMMGTSSGGLGCRIARTASR